MSVEPEEIFELIIKADEKLKYAHEDNAGLRRQQARDLLVRAREAATEIGNDALVRQGGHAARRSRRAGRDGAGELIGGRAEPDQPGRAAPTKLSQ